MGHSGRLLCYLMISNCPSFLYFQYVYVHGGNPGVDFDLKGSFNLPTHRLRINLNG